MSKGVRKLIEKYTYKNTGNKKRNQHAALKQNSETYKVYKERQVTKKEIK